MSVLESILDKSQLTLKEFMGRYFAREPFAAPGGAVDFCGKEWSRILTEILRNHDDCWLANRGQLSKGSGFLTVDSAMEGFRRGNTILVRHTECAHPFFAGLAEDFHQVFGQPIDIQVYCTPGGHQGFDWHYDVEDVFVVQTSGQKEFYLRKNKVERPPIVRLPKTWVELEEQFDGPEIRCLLEAGDWLYIPAGYWHKAVAHSQSLHFSIGVMPDYHS